MISKIVERIFRTSLLALLVLQLLACDSNDDVERFLQAEEVAALDLSSLSLEADVVLLNKGEKVQLHVSGKNSAGVVIPDLDTKVEWKSSNTGIASVDSSGLMTAIADGVVTISASYAHLQANSTLTINTADLVQLNLSGDLMVDECKTASLNAKGSYSDGSTRPISSGLTWSVSDTTVASIKQSSTDNDSATLMTHKPGVITVQASKNQVTGVLDVEIKDALEELLISPMQANVSVGRTVTYGATGVYPGSETTDITASTLWTAVDSAIADYQAATNGVLSAISAGSTGIVASCGELSKNAVVTVDELILSRVEINYNKSSITLDVDDDGYQLTLRATYSDESVVDVTDDADWSNITDASGSIVVSDDDDDKGELTIIGTGSANIEADFGGKSDSILIVVE